MIPKLPSFVTACVGLLFFATGALQAEYIPSIYYGAGLQGGVLNSNGGIASAYTGYVNYPDPEKEINLTVKDGNDLLSHNAQKRYRIAFPGSYNSGGGVAFNSEQEVLVQMTDTENVLVYYYEIFGEVQEVRIANLMGGAIIKNGVLTEINAGPTSRWYDLADDGTAVGAKYFGTDQNGYWAPVFYKNGVLTEIPLPDGTPYGFTADDRKILKDDSAFATAITQNGKILCTGSVTPKNGIVELGPYSTIACGAGSTGIVFIYDIATGISTEVTGIPDYGASSKMPTATDMNAAGEIVVSLQEWNGFGGPGISLADDCHLYLPAPKYGLPAGFNSLTPPSYGTFEDFMRSRMYSLTDTGQIFTAEQNNHFTEYWDNGTFKDLKTGTLIPGYTILSFYDVNERNQVLVTARQETGEAYKPIHSFVLNGQTGIVVNVVTDGEDPDPDDDDIDSDPTTPGQQVSLRAAIQAVNAGKGNTIKFAIPGSAVPKITLTKALPVVEQAVTIDASTQEAGMVELDGNNLNTAGLNLHAGNSEVRGMIFHGFIGSEGAGIRISGDGQNRIFGNYFGVDTTGTLPMAISRGILIDQSTSNIIGGSGPGEANIIWATNLGIRIQGEDSNDNRIVANRIGLGANGEGLINSNGTSFINGVGVSIENGSNNQIGGAGALGNLIAGDFGVIVSPTAAISGTKILGNRIGLNEAGDTVVGAEVGIFLSQPQVGTLANTTIENNKISGHRIADIWMLGKDIANTTISNNQIGLKFDTSGAIPSGPEDAKTIYGIRIDGSTQSTIAENTIAGQFWNISLAGEVSVTMTPLVDADNDGIPESGGLLEFSDPTEGLVASADPSNGKDTAITDNILGMNAANAMPTGIQQVCGVALFGSPRSTTVSGNISAGHEIAELWIQDGDGHSISSNFLGTPDGSVKGSQVGILLENAFNSTIGAGNVLGANAQYGMRIEGTGAEITVSGNKIGTNAAGLIAWPNAIGLSVADQDSTNALQQITVSGNTISGNTTTGLELNTTDNELKITDNRIGLGINGAALSNQVGIAVIAGKPEITGSTIAHNAIAGISISDENNASINLSDSSIYENGTGIGAAGIVYESAPHSPPSNFAALRTVNSSGNLKIVFALPVLGATAGPPPALPGDTVTVEFFANRNGSDTQGRVPLFTRQIDPTKTWSELFEVDQTSHMATMGTFTVTLSRRGRTSEFSSHRVSQPFVWPEISFVPSQPGELTMSWPDPGIPGLFTLEENRDLMDVGLWNTYIQTPSTSGGMASVTVPIQEGSQFFRLRVNAAAALQNSTP